jgi:hypothetical protein
MLELNCEVSMGIALLGLLKVIEYAGLGRKGGHARLLVSSGNRHLRTLC